MIKQYVLIAILSFIVLSSLIIINKELNKHNMNEWFNNRERMINTCRIKVDEALGEEWERSCKASSLTGNCTLPINFYQTIIEDRKRQYKICTETYK